MASGWPIRSALDGIDMVTGDRTLQGHFVAQASTGRGVGPRNRNAIEDPSDDPGTALEKKDKSAMLRKCLAGLSAEHREIIDLVYYHEKSVEEVAEIVGIPQNTVKTRMFYARKRLAERLKSEGIERGWP